jgi:hypothetical protein
MSDEITRGVSMTRTGTREDGIDLEIVLSPVGDEPAEWTDVTMSLLLNVGTDMQPTVVDVPLVPDGESRAEATVPLGTGFDASGSVTVRALIMHGTRFYGMREFEI